MKSKKYEPKINLGAINIDLDEIPDTIDMSIGPPPEKATEAAKRPKKQDSKTIPLF